MAQKLRPTKDVLHEDLAGEVVLLELSAGVYFSLDEVGSRIWKLLIAGNTREQIAVELTREFDVSIEQATADVTRLVDDLAQNKLVEQFDE